LEKSQKDAGIISLPTYRAILRPRPFQGQALQEKLKAGDLALAQRKLRDFKNDLERTDAGKGNKSFAAVLGDYAETLQGAESTLTNKLAVVAKLKETWFGVASLPLRTIEHSQVSKWLNEHYGRYSAAYFNSALAVIRSGYRRRHHRCGQESGQGLEIQKASAADSVNTDVRGIPKHRGFHSRPAVQRGRSGLRRLR